MDLIISDNTFVILLSPHFSNSISVTPPPRPTRIQTIDTRGADKKNDLPRMSPLGVIFNLHIFPESWRFWLGCVYFKCLEYLCGHRCSWSCSSTRSCHRWTSYENRTWETFLWRIFILVVWWSRVSSWDPPSAMRLPSSDIRRRWTIKGYDVE